MPTAAFENKSSLYICLIDLFLEEKSQRMTAPGKLMSP
jgi:hypothetical protein